MVTVCLECNSDVDTLENPKAGHKPDCPTKRNCAKCKEGYFPTYKLNSVNIERLTFREKNHNQPRDYYYEKIDLCLSCELNIWNMVRQVE